MASATGEYLHAASNRTVSLGKKSSNRTLTKNTPTTSSPFSNVEEPLVPEPLSPNSRNSKRNWTHKLRPRVTKYPNGTRRTTRLRHQHLLIPPWPPLLHHPSFLSQELRHPTTPSQPQALLAQPRPVSHRQATTTHRPRQRCIPRPKGTRMTNNSSLLYSKHTPTTHTAQT